ncbi:MAG TPA: Ni/Fe hydrogenase subunit alpha [Bacteroidales bacterium]|nr:Ni/Fe hydrogenase subunit alpha [Bacteroidales bacterium]HPO66058.1 Ni/Fe hydrogenase subunit alpha [Bacteroidales bacterium]
MGQKITIDPVTRVEGHGKVTLYVNNDGGIEQARFHIVEFRGFERFVQGRPFWEMPVLVQRLCGICPVSHHLAAAKAVDVIVGAGSGDELTPTAEKMRRLMHYGQIFQSHALHFFYLASPDLLFGIDADPAKRNVLYLAQENRDLAYRAILMRKFGQEIILATAGKKIHGTGAIPGGINKHLTIEERDRFLHGNPPFNIDNMIQWSLDTLEFFHQYEQKHRDFLLTYVNFPSNYLSLVRKDGAMDLYHGVLRAVDAEGQKILPDVDYHEYYKYIEEEVRSWSYMKFPYLKMLGQERGWYTVGPLARINTADFIDTPLAQKELELFRSFHGGKPCNHVMHTHWARLIEILHAAEKIKLLLEDPDLLSGELVREGNRQFEGVGLLEAPRGTLFHHYKINEYDQIVQANLIVSTTNNNQAMNNAVLQVAQRVFKGQKKVTEGMTNAIEVAIRAYNPCLSCATHALGQMPIDIEFVDVPR